MSERLVFSETRKRYQEKAPGLQVAPALHDDEGYLPVAVSSDFSQCLSTTSHAPSRTSRRRCSTARDFPRIDIKWHSGYLLIGYTDDLSLLVSEEAYETSDPTFEIIDHERNTTYWVREIPTPQQAQQLLDEHGELPEEV
jgi:hypothetical protein